MDTLYRTADVLEAPAPDASSTPGVRRLTVQLFRWDDPRPVVDAMPELREYRERWARDSIPYHGPDTPGARVRLFDQHHGTIVGHVTRLWDGGPGPHAEMVVADTTRARDALALIDAGTTGGVSVEFQPVEGGEVWNAERTEVTRTRAAITGVAFAFLPAHDSPILATREATTMPDTDTLETIPATPAAPATPAPPAPVPVSGDAMRGELDQLRAMVLEGRSATTATATATRYRSLGDAMRGAARGDPLEPEWRDLERGGGVFLTRALVDVTTADVPGLIPRTDLARLFTVIAAAQPLVEAAGSVPLPASGMDISYPAVTARPIVDVQAAEKTDIASAKTTIGRQTVPIVTLAGGEDTSVQVIQRSDPAYLTIMGQLYAEAMATATDAYVLGRYDAATLPAGHLVSIGTDPKLWVTNLANLVGTILADSRRFPNRMVLSVDLWTLLVGAVDTEGRPLFPAAATPNQIGNASLDSTDGNLAGMRWTVDPNLPTDRGLLFSSEAFITSLGGVQTMTVDVPSKLGRDYAMFRFGAAAAVDPAGMSMFSTGLAPTTAGAEGGRRRSSSS